jgi:hypothetical protein
MHPSGAWYQDDPNQRSPYSQYYSFGIQHALPGNMVLDLAYVGTRGVKLPAAVEGNPAPPGPLSDVEARRIYHNIIPDVGAITYLSNMYSSTYHSFQAKLEKRMSNGLQFLTTYTWSKSIDDASGSTVTGAGDLGSAPQDPFNIRAERARSGFDRTHRLTTAFSYILPVGRGQHFGSKCSPITDAILGGWQINGIVTLASGNPFTVYATSNDICGCSTGQLRADRLGNGNLPKDKRSIDGWFDKSAFTDPPSSTATEGGGRYGNSGRNIIGGPGLANVDFSVFKKFHIKEKLEVEFRAEFFNFFNRVNFLYPVDISNATWQTGGLITKSLAPRIGQVALKIVF